MSDADQPLLRIENLRIALPAHADRPFAVEDVSLDLARNEILCVVGESGSGKSVMSRAVMGLYTSRHVRPVGGRIVFDGEDLLQASPERMRQVRGNRIAMIFQEPMTALNPVLRIGAQIAEVLGNAVSPLMPAPQTGLAETRRRTTGVRACRRCPASAGPGEPARRRR